MTGQKPLLLHLDSDGDIRTTTSWGVQRPLLSATVPGSRNKTGQGPPAAVSNLSLLDSSNVDALSHRVSNQAARDSRMKVVRTRLYRNAGFAK